VQPQSIAIIGAGTAGLATAALLAQQGHAITLIERAPALEPVGAGLLLQPAGLSVLHRMGLYQAMYRYGAHIDALVGHTYSGRAIMNSHYRPLGEQAHGLGIHRASLCHVLDSHLQTLPHQRRMASTVIAVDSQPQQATVTLEQKHENRTGTQTLTFDAVLIANGSHSQLRPAAWTRYDRLYPWGAMWAMLPMTAPFDVPLLQQRYHRASAMAGILPTGSRPDQPETPLASFFWSLPVTEIAHWQQPDFAASPFEKWRGALHTFWPQLDEVLTPLTQAQQLTPATYRDVIMSKWGDNRLGVIGDAAHAMSPQLGQGANMALLDAWALGDAMQQSDNWHQVWAHYHQHRGPQIRFYQRMSRWLTPAFQSHSRVVATGRDLLFPLLNHLPWMRLQMARTIAGLKTGLLR